jgi:5'-deoxynucleotidase YfbR-like HD superfamily hydrolase
MKQRKKTGRILMGIDYPEDEGNEQTYFRYLTRLDLVRDYIDDKYKSLKDEELKRNAYVHSYGVGQAASLLALYRGFDEETAEMACIAGMFHDFAKYYVEDTDDHAHVSAKIAESFLRETGDFTEDEIRTITEGIYHHSDKMVDDNVPFNDIIKDADALQHYLRNPMEKYWLEKSRVKKTVEELKLNGH